MKKTKKIQKIKKLGKEHCEKSYFTILRHLKQLYSRLCQMIKYIDQWKTIESQKEIDSITSKPAIFFFFNKV